MSKPWFRMYAEFASDPKMQLLAFEDQRHFIILLCLKCNGTLDSSVPSPELRDKMIAKALGLEVSMASEVRRRLIEVGVIDADAHPIKWDSRQYDSDSSTERTRAWRQKKLQAADDGDEEKRHCDVTVTDESRVDKSRIEQSRTESETHTRTASRKAFRLPDDFELTDERRLVAEAETLPAERTFEKFRDYWRSASGAKARKLDWDATWRNWCKSEADRFPSKFSGGPEHAGKQAETKFDRLRYGR